MKTLFLTDSKNIELLYKFYAQEDLPLYFEPVSEGGGHCMMKVQVFEEGKYLYGEVQVNKFEQVPEGGRAGSPCLVKEDARS